VGLRWSGWSLGLTILGLFLVAFSLVWLLAIFPAMAKLPADLDKAVYFEGTYTVMNPETEKMDEIPVNVERLQQATEVQDNVLLINETVTCIHALAGMELPQFGATSVLGVDRSTRAYASGCGDMERTGQFTFPSGVKKGNYSMWVSTAGCALEAEFTGEEDFHGLKVFSFQISEQGLDIGSQAGTGIPQVLDLDTNLKVEPVSGAPVYTESYMAIKIVPAPEMQVPIYISSLSFTDDTVVELVDSASSGRIMILWATVYGFWLAVGLGGALILVGVIMAARTEPD
jgi:hypothetical protein